MSTVNVRVSRDLRPHVDRFGNISVQVEIRTCVRPDCGETFRFRRADAAYCSRRCARIVAQRELRKRQKAGQ
jgi:hypothetical protein